MTSSSDDVFRDRYGFTWKTVIYEHKVREIIFGPFKLVLELQPKICQAVVYIFLYDKGKSRATFDIKTYVLNNEEKKACVQPYKGSLANGPTIWSMKRCELLKKENIFCASGKLTFGFEINPIIGTLDVETSSRSKGFDFCNAVKSVDDVFKTGSINLGEKHLTSLEKMSLDFGKLFENEGSSNVVLNCLDRQIKAHRCVLSARSDVFAAMFRSDMLESQQGVVTIKDVDPEILEQMLRYIYSGTIEKLTVKTSSELYEATDKYGIASLKNRCGSFLTENLSQVSACDVLLLADTYSDEQLENSAVDFMVENCAFLRTDQWNKFCEEHPFLGNKVYRKYLKEQARCRTRNKKCTPPVDPSLKSLGSAQLTNTGGFSFGRPEQHAGPFVMPPQSTFLNAGFSHQPTKRLREVPTVAPEAPHGNLSSTKSVSEAESKSEEENSISLEKMSLDFGKMFDNEVESDVVLKCADRRIKAHRSLLSARSDVFAAILVSSVLENNEAEVPIKDVTPETLERMLRYIYSAKVEELTLETASKLYEAADNYEIESLKKHCRSFLKENLSQTSACDILVLADTHSDEQLQNSAMDFMVKNCELMFADQWNKFCEERPSLGIKVHRKYVDMQPQSSNGLLFK